MPLLDLPATIETARIKDLPLFSTFGPLTSQDTVPFWLAAFEKTVQVDTASLFQFMQGVSQGTITPVILGDKYLYIVPAAAAGTDTAPIPSLAGQNFFLQNQYGYPFTTTEFEILNSGGFKLTNGEKLIEGDRYILSLYALQGGTSGQTNTYKPLIIGAVTVSTNLNFDVVQHVNKLLQLRGGTTSLQFTLARVADIPANTIIIIESMISNSAEHKILTQGGELIYINNTAKTSIYMRAGEVLWLYRSDDGYFVMNQDFAKMYNEIGIKPTPAFAVGMNELALDGSQYSRAAYPRLWERIQSLGYSLVNHSTWLTASEILPSSGVVVPYPYRGCFSDGDGSSTFFVPDFRKMAVRGLNDLYGSDSERFYNHPGGYQKDEFEAHAHTYPLTSDATPNGPYVYSRQNDSGQKGNTSTVGGNETRMENIGVIYTIKC